MSCVIVPVANFDIQPMTTIFHQDHPGMSSIVVTLDHKSSHSYINEMKIMIGEIYFYTNTGINTTIQDVYMYFPYYLNEKVVNSHNSLLEKYSCSIFHFRYVSNEEHMNLLLSETKFKVVTRPQFKEYKYVITPIVDDETKNILTPYFKNNNFVEYDINNPENNDISNCNKVFMINGNFLKVYTIDVNDIMFLKFKFNFKIHRLFYFPYVWTIPMVVKNQEEYINDNLQDTI